MRKTMAALFLALVLMVPFASAEAPQQELLGMWYGTEVVMGEMVLPIASLGMEASMDIREDGTAVLSISGMETSGTWTKDAAGAIVLNDGETTNVFTLVDGKLHAESEGFTVVFGREPAAAAPALEEISTDATAEDFVGAWVGTEMNAGGVAMPIATFGIEARIELGADGQALFTMTAEGEAQTMPTTWTIDGYTASVIVEGVASAMTIRGGRLAMEADEGVLLIFDREA